jgi:hypothetical protein
MNFGARVSIKFLSLKRDTYIRIYGKYLSVDDSDIQQFRQIHKTSAFHHSEDLGYETALSGKWISTFWPEGSIMFLQTVAPTYQTARITTVSTKRMEAVWSSETSESTYETIWYYNISTLKMEATSIVLKGPLTRLYGVIRQNTTICVKSRSFPFQMHEALLPVTQPTSGSDRLTLSSLKFVSKLFQNSVTCSQKSLFPLQDDLINAVSWDFENRVKLVNTLLCGKSMEFLTTYLYRAKSL